VNKKIVFIGVFLGLVLLFLTVKPLVSPPAPPKPDWETYRNQKYHYQLLYPLGWEVEEWDIQEAAKLKKVPDGSIWHQAKFSGPEGQFEVLIWENKSKVPVRTWLNWFRHEDLILKAVPQEANFSVAELPAISFFKKETAREVPLLYVFFGQEDKVYELVMTRDDLIRIATPSGEQLNHPAYDKMVESFKFMVE
jgi:hypothetical protein